MSYLLALMLLLQELSSNYRVVADNRLCDGSIADSCSGGDINEELVIESESHRRVLWGNSISYGAIRRDLPACGDSSAGSAKPYSITCLPQSSNRYTRGCSSIYRCRH
ncbi:hypothetical protein ERO13_A09G207300v2 [Gossypium hirsutum]|uniref:Protein RALF-like 32 n=6 Tax=Gossypium TaxID=3633 RepID=A0ABR0NWN3_GOSAR|nr:protein RALF-like 32 [Gossypium australe]KAB2067309.1 hypothetical protein ES319_A09G217900v1 [Gossypium barbadense]KAG4185033.1 hypothetical protein ERO13_A09G207300v2 [Gossypium hirsutum]KAK5804831.1 hypothetical protein PVK06_032482 [Gossypium arboreum]TYH03723.1 hypothetical protein ES288_A09G241900v1 [Gossypium darwinii]TYI11887.1 hypothetical protein ES332_A09G237400v1 [Gossypium tomentosum]TYJ19876.1 hypothetical protein E1A91_A09G221500v1 [Gossypium mustelinum]